MKGNEDDDIMVAGEGMRGKLKPPLLEYLACTWVICHQVEATAGGEPE